MSIPSRLHTRLKELLADYGARVRTLVEGHGLAKHGIDGADIEQEVRIRLWRTLEREPDAAINGSYIQRVVLSTVIDAIRAASCRPTEPLPDEDIEYVAMLDPAAGPEQTAITAEQVTFLGACVSKLPGRRRAAVQFHLLGFTAREVGEFSGISEEAARKLLDRGLATLRELLSTAGASEILRSS